MLSSVSPSEDIKLREAAQLKRIAAVCPGKHSTHPVRFRTRKDDLSPFSFWLRGIKIGNAIRLFFALFLSQNIVLASPTPVQLCGAFIGQMEA